MVYEVSYKKKKNIMVGIILIKYKSQNIKQLKLLLWKKKKTNSMRLHYVHCLLNFDKETKIRWIIAYRQKYCKQQQKNHYLL